MFLHLSHSPLKDIKERGSVVFPGPMFYGKPLGLWYAPDLVWVKRLDELGQWVITAGKSKLRGDYTCILEFYEKVFGKKEIPAYTPGDEMTKFFSSVPPHYVYNFPLAGTFSDTASTSKIFNLTKSSTPTFLKAFREYYTKSLMTEIKSRNNSFWIRMKAKSEILREPEITEVKKYLAENGVEIGKTKLDDLRPVFIQAMMIDELLSMGVPEDTVRKAGTVATWKGLPAGALSFPTGFKIKTGIFERIPLTVMGIYLEEVMRPKWGGINFDESLFDGSLDAELPMLKWIELPSGCIWNPPAVMPSYTPEPIVVMAIASSAEEATTFTEPNTFVAGQKTDGTLVLFKKGVFVGGRGRTFRRRTMRRSKNGHRPTRKSKRRGHGVA